MRLSLAIVVAALLAAPAAAQDDDDFWSGTHVLRRLLHDRKFTPLRSWDDLAADPDKTLLVFLGNPNGSRNNTDLTRIPGGLSFFIQEGGAALLATDHALQDQGVTAACGYYVTGVKVRARPGNQERIRNTLDPRFERHVEEKAIYRNLPQCLIPQPENVFDPPLFWSSPLPLNRRAYRLATNRPSYLMPNQGAKTASRVLARLPLGSFYSGTGYMPRGWMPRPFAVASEPGNGRFLMLADHSVFYNDLMIEGIHFQDNDNFLFAYNAVDWLRGKDGQRDRVLFVEDGVIETELSPTLRREEFPLRQLQMELVAQVNDELAMHQKRYFENNLHNEDLIGGLNHVSGRTIFGPVTSGNFYRLLVLAAALGLCIYGFRRMTRAVHKHDLAVPVFANVAGKHRPAASTLTMRQRVAFEENDLRDFAREAAREWFSAIPGRPDSGEVEPTVEARGGWWKRQSLRREVLGLWRFAWGGDRARLTKVEFRRFLARLDALRKAVAKGDLRINW